MKEMLGFFKIRRGHQKLFGVPFNSLLPFGPLAPQLLKAFPLMWFNLIGCQCVSPKKWAIKERLFCVFSIWYIGLLSILEVPFV